MIYIKSGDKVFITTTESENNMAVTSTYQPDGDTNLDGVIFSRSDLVLNGTGTLTIESADGNGVVAKDDLKITGGTYEVVAADDGFEANDAIAIYDGTINVVSGQDAFHSENEDDLTLGYIYVQGGTLNINAGDDGVRGTSIVRIDGGVINIEIIGCQTANMGSHRLSCECGHEKVVHNSCYNRHCPICGNFKKEMWIQKQQESTIPNHYFHLVFTIPSTLRPLVYYNQKAIYNLMYQASSKTLLELSKEKLGTIPGFSLILHTWS